VDATVLDGSFAGRDFDHALLADLPDAAWMPAAKTASFPHICLRRADVSRAGRGGGREIRKNSDGFVYADLLRAARYHELGTWR